MTNSAPVSISKSNLFSGWSATLLSLAAGAFWVGLLANPDGSFRLYHPDMLGYVLLLAGIITFPVMLHASICSATGRLNGAERISHVVSLAVPSTFTFAWLLCRVCDLLIISGVA